MSQEYTAVHERLTITDADQLHSLLRKGALFRNCKLDDADLASFDA